MLCSIDRKRIFEITPFAHCLALGLVLTLNACASIDFTAPKSQSHALTDTDTTQLGESLAYSHGYPEGHSGFHLLSDAIDALAVRLLVADAAQRSLDVQYYLINNDIIGRVFLAYLLKAADRGVRIRLLIDDISTRNMEELLAGLASHPNLELRLFNPFANRRFRGADAWDFARLNRRMHNKSLTADNQVTIVGGRNIAREYFAANMEYNFGDLDTLAIGPVVQDTSAMFDAFWAHERAVPYEQLSEQQPDQGERLAAAVAKLEDAVERVNNSVYGKALSSAYSEYLATSASRFEVAPYRLVFDSPDKVFGKVSGNEAIVTPLGEAARSAKQELLVISPYFVPRAAGIKSLQGMADTGVQIDVVTNGLAASDHIWVYGGYAPARKPLLRHGVRLFEMRGDQGFSGTVEAGTEKAKSSLHTKAFVVDKRYVFMGSFNWDPRSSGINTELGILMDAPKIAGEITGLVETTSAERGYQPFLNERGDINWRSMEGGEWRIYDKEPESSWGRRAAAKLTRLLPIRSQL